MIAFRVSPHPFQRNFLTFRTQPNYLGGHTMNSNLTISTTGRQLLKRFEGLRLRAYQDSVGVWTIGYGHTKGVTRGMAITEAQANQYLNADIKTHATGIYRYVTVKLNQHQFDALVSFHFNLGPHILQNTALLKYLNAQQWQQAATEMRRYKYAGGIALQGLANRRQAETELFLKPVTQSTPTKPKQPAKTPATANPQAKTYKVKAGDTLSHIVLRHHTTVAKLVRLNKIANPNLIRVGQIIKLR